MKNLLITAVLLTTMLSVKAQTKNHEGLYVDASGNLFSGTISVKNATQNSEFSVRNGTVDGAVKYYYPSGELMETGTFADGKKNDKWTRYSKNGRIEAIAFYNLGKKTGTWLVFDEKGNKRFEMMYDNGEKTGTWTSWDENGSVSGVQDHSKLN